MTRALGASSTPLDDGFYFPADDVRHAQIWLPWPHEPALRDTVAEIARIIAKYEPVAITAAPQTATAARAASGAANVVLLPSVSPRLRDIGPSFLIDGKGGSAAADWGFDGWGQRRDDARADATFAHELLGEAEVRRFRTPLKLEGSAFVADGTGTLIALAETVFDPARNPGVTRLEAFAILQKWLGAARVIWLERGLSGDPFRADVRALATFLAPGVVALSTAPEDHPDAAILRDARTALMRAKDGAGRPLRILDLPLPPVVMQEGHALPLAYTNILHVNGAVLTPMFGAPTDAHALEALARAFPGREIVPVQALALAMHGVSLTALALPQPARLLQRDRATTLPRSARMQPALDDDEMLQKYIEMARKD